MKNNKNKIRETLKYTIEQLERFFILSKEEQLEAINLLKEELKKYE